MLWENILFMEQSLTRVKPMRMNGGVVASLLHELVDQINVEGLEVRDSCCETVEERIHREQ